MLKKNHIKKEYLDNLIFLPLKKAAYFLANNDEVSATRLSTTYGTNKLYVGFNKKFYKAYKDARKARSNKYYNLHDFRYFGIFTSDGKELIPVDWHLDSDYEDDYYVSTNDSGFTTLIDIKNCARKLHVPGVEKCEIVSLKSEEAKTTYFVFKQNDGLIKCYMIKNDGFIEVIGTADNVTSYKVFEERYKTEVYDKKRNLVDSRYASGNWYKVLLVFESTNPQKDGHPITVFNFKGEVLHGESITKFISFYSPILVQVKDAEEDYYYGILCNNKGEFLTDKRILKFEEVSKDDSPEDLFKAKMLDEKFMLFDGFGNPLFENTYEEIYPFCEKSSVTLAKVKDEQYVVIDREGNVTPTDKDIINVIKPFKEYQTSIGTIVLAQVQFEKAKPVFIDKDCNRYIEAPDSITGKTPRYVRVE